MYIYWSLYIINWFFTKSSLFSVFENIHFYDLFYAKSLQVNIGRTSYEIIFCDLGTRSNIWKSRKLKRRLIVELVTSLANNLPPCINCTLPLDFSDCVAYKKNGFARILAIKRRWTLGNNKYVTKKSSEALNFNSVGTSDIVQADAVCGENDFNTVHY